MLANRSQDETKPSIWFFLKASILKKDFDSPLNLSLEMEKRIKCTNITVNFREKHSWGICPSGYPDASLLFPSSQEGTEMFLPLFVFLFWFSYSLCIYLFVLCNQF